MLWEFYNRVLCTWSLGNILPLWKVPLATTAVVDSLPQIGLIFCLTYLSDPELLICKRLSVVHFLLACSMHCAVGVDWGADGRGEDRWTNLLN